MGIFGSRQPAERPRPSNDVELLAWDQDTFARMQKRATEPEHIFQNLLGLDAGLGLVATGQRHNVLILGPPRCFKSSGVLAPQVLAAPGPVVSTSVREDMYLATAQSRARKGMLWHLDLDERLGLLPGCRQLRWSPITASIEWGKANITGHGMAAQAEVAQGSTDASYFRKRAGELISGMLHAAALAGKDLGWVMSGVSGDRKILDDAVGILRSDGHHLSLDPLRAIVNQEARTRDSILSTAQTAFIAFRDPKAYESTLNPNFDPFAFVKGQPDAVNMGLLDPTDSAAAESLMNQDTSFYEWARGIYDTIYITAPTAKQTVVAPLITGLLAEIREATFSLNARANLDGRDSPHPVLWALDECASIAPLSDLPESVSQGAGQGLLVTIVLQELSLAEKRWKEDHKSFLTLFADHVIFPGIANNETNELISKLFGKEWISRPQTSTTHSRTVSKESSTTSSTTTSEQEHLLPVLEATEIAHGRARTDYGDLDPRRMLIAKNAGASWQWGYAMPYFNTAPIAHMCVSSMEYQANRMSAFDIRSFVRPPNIPPDGLENADTDLPQRVAALAEPRRDLEQRQRQIKGLMQSPLLEGWTGEEGFHDPELFAKERSALITSNVSVDIGEQFKGLDIEPYDKEYCYFPETPEKFWLFKFEQCRMHIAQYTDPVSIDLMLRRSNITDVKPIELLAIDYADRVGEFVIWRLAKLANTETIYWLGEA